MPQPPVALGDATLLLDTLSAVRVRTPAAWSEKAKAWVLELDVQTRSGPHVPSTTTWSVHIGPDFPLGDIKVFPHKTNGLTATFPHQNYNELGKSDVPWRTGDVCLSTPFRVLGRAAPPDEPGDAGRLIWYVQALLDWLDAAATGTLTAAGQPFELPHFPPEGTHEVTFSETTESFESWSARAETRGTALTRAPWETHRAHVVIEFRDEEDEILWETKWGDFIDAADHERTRVAWIRVPRPPVLDPWQAPRTWGELRDALAKQGVDLHEQIKSLLPKLRDADRHLLLLGFPIPEKQGGPPSRIHWQGLRLPPLRPSKGLKRGYRANTEAEHDLIHIIRSDTKIDWLKSTNWADDQLLTRGRLSSGMSRARVGLLGAGAVGSLLAEPMLRAGLRRIVVVDDENLQTGNLARHTLNAYAVGSKKAAHLVGRSRAISPHVSAHAIPKKIQELDEDDEQQLQDCDIIIDATGARDTPTLIERAAWAKAKLVVVVSVAPDADRFHIHAARAFSASQFIIEVGPLLIEDLARTPPSTFPREGLGCWHPVFPAAHPDIQTHCGIAARLIDEILAKKRPEGTYVIEKTTSPDIGFHVRRIGASSGDTKSAE